MSPKFHKFIKKRKNFVLKFNYEFRNLINLLIINKINLKKRGYNRHYVKLAKKFKPQKINNNQ